METLLVVLIVIVAAAYAARSLLPQAWLPRRLRRVQSPADGCSACGPGTDPRPAASTRRPQS
jgi:hypothetical protein